MNTFVIVCLSVFEVISLWLIVRLWVQKRRMPIIPRIFWSLMLLVPVFGLIMFGFICSDLDKNPDHMETDTDRNAPLIGDGSH